MEYDRRYFLIGISALGIGAVIGGVATIDRKITQSKIQKQILEARTEVANEGTPPADQSALDAAQRLRTEIINAPLEDRCQSDKQEEMRQARGAEAQQRDFAVAFDRPIHEKRVTDGPSTFKVEADECGQIIGGAGASFGLLNIGLSITKLG